MGRDTMAGLISWGNCATLTECSENRMCALLGMWLSRTREETGETCMVLRMHQAREKILQKLPKILMKLEKARGMARDALARKSDSEYKAARRKTVELRKKLVAIKVQAEIAALKIKIKHMKDVGRRPKARGGDPNGEIKSCLARLKALEGRLKRYAGE